MSAIEYDIVIVGAGASGALTAVQLRRRAPAPKVGLVEGGARVARGLAYGTPYGAHLLNVPARGMSAFPEEPNHFAGWLASRLPGSSGETFAPRPLYGEYLSELVAGGAGESGAIDRIAGTAVGMTRAARGWVLHLHDGGTVRARAVVLALGNLPPDDPAALTSLADERYVRDPWAPGAAAGLDRDATVLMIGAGLTMVDLLLTLQVEGHRGPVHALSRHGALPREHAPAAPRPLAAAPSLPTPRAAAARVRGVARAATREGGDWRSVIDSLRPHTAAIWSGWDLRGRRSFLRHARYLWDAHRHRVAPEVGARVRDLLEKGALVVHRGRITAVEATPSGLTVRWRRGAGREESRTVARVINCTGPRSDYATLDVPLVAALRRGGYLVPDPLGLGVETGTDGALIGRDGAPVEGLFTLGPLRRPALWETTAIPEIRAQAAALARRLAEAIGAE